jgi:hypothetical protein
MATVQIGAPCQQGLAMVSPRLSPGAPASRELIVLRAAFSQDEANHGTARYPVGVGGLVRVPIEAVGPLMTVGGFVPAKTTGESVSSGALRLHHDDATGCSYAGLQYLSDFSGDVTVPAEAASELASHGFVPVVDKANAASSRSPSERHALHIKA